MGELTEVASAKRAVLGDFSDGAAESLEGVRVTETVGFPSFLPCVGLSLPLMMGRDPRSVWCSLVFW